jgi:hypothetical protein
MGDTKLAFVFLDIYNVSVWENKTYLSTDLVVVYLGKLLVTQTR